MPRNMSFAMTTPQFRARTKTVTRRFGWWFLQPGDIVMGVERSRGLKKGEKVTRLGLIRIVSVAAEPAAAITGYRRPAEELAAEGFPDMAPAAFVAMLCKANGRDRSEQLNRIAFEYLD
jgi:hypothetical protein